MAGDTVSILEGHTFVVSDRSGGSAPSDDYSVKPGDFAGASAGGVS